MNKLNVRLILFDLVHSFHSCKVLLQHFEFYLQFNYNKYQKSACQRLTQRLNPKYWALERSIMVNFVCKNNNLVTTIIWLVTRKDCVALTGAVDYVQMASINVLVLLQCSKSFYIPFEICHIEELPYWSNNNI